MEITPDLVGKAIDVYALFSTDQNDCDVKVYLAPKHDGEEGVVVEL